MTAIMATVISLVKGISWEVQCFRRTWEQPDDTHTQNTSAAI